MPTTILLLISLLLHVVAFYFIIVLYMKYSTMKNLTNTQRQILEETENSMTSFLIDMKDENERLIQTLLNSSSMKVQSMDNDLNEANLGINSELDKNQLKQKSSSKGIDQDLKELPSHLSGIGEMKDSVEITQTYNKKNPPFEIEAINLYEEGYTVEQIAKKLKKGKTEVELLIKFRQK